MAGAYRSSVARVHNTQVHQYAAVDFPVIEHTLGGPPVQTVHPGLAMLPSKSCNEEVPLLNGQERCRLRPVRCEKLAGCTNDNSCQALDDENPKRISFGRLVA